MSDDNQPLLFSLDGSAAPEGLGKSLLLTMDLTEEVREQIGVLVQAVLESMPEEQLDDRITRLCESNQLEVEVAGTAVKATRFLLRSAAACNVESRRLAEDIAALGGPVPLVDLLTALYDRCLPELRREIAQATILAHGKVLTGVEWRVDTLGTSSRGRGINLPVALVTLIYRDGDDTKRITLQALPDAVNLLRQVCDQLLH